MSQRVLIMCDDPLFRAAVKATLSRAGFEAVGPDGFEAAWALFTARQFDLLFCDLGEDETARLARLSAPEARECWGCLLVSTDSSGRLAALESIRREGGEVLAKPLRHGDLLEAASRLVLRRLEAGPGGAAGPMGQGA
ncbi:MAG: hypothetical protein ACP59X_01065 [Solidesulfovibrio sp. DCME]|uniref:hypothetical protein n=1 Tax=Solidesulfovibrio sp. DCME TaxID=3447380 RepID=UPI003D12EA53